MNETRISYQTAKLALEKGFEYPYFTLWSPGARYNEGTPQSVLQKWLRDKHSISCLVDSNHSGWFWMINKTNGTRIKDQTDYLWFDSYEQALEAGLLESLNLL